MTDHNMGDGARGMKQKIVNSTISLKTCTNTGSIRDYPYWTCRRNSLELTELSSIIGKLNETYL